MLRGCALAERLAYLEAVVGADITQFRKGMRDIRNEVGVLSESMAGIGAVGRTMTFAVTAPLVTLGTFAVQAASEFDAAMRNVNSVLQLSEEEFSSLSDGVLRFGSAIRSGPVGAAEALNVAAQAGITNTATALEFMGIASRTAEAGLADIQTTTEALVAAFLSYGGMDLPLADQLAMMSEQSNILTQTVQIGVGTMDTFATALGRAVPTGQAVGATFSDIAGIMAYMTQRGVQATTAGTNLSGAISAMLKPSTAMKEAFEELGVAGGEELVAQMGGLEEALIAIIGTADGSSTALAQIFQNRQAFRAAQTIAEDIDGLTASMENFESSLDGATDRAHAQQMKSFAAQWDLMTSAVNAAAITIGEALLPVLVPVVQAVADLAVALVEANPELVAIGVAAAGAVAAIGPLLWLLSSLASPLGALIVGTGALATAFAADFGGIRSIVQDTVESIFGDLEGLGDLLSDITDTLFPENAETVIADAMPDPVTVDPTDFITFTVGEGESPWTIWTRDFADDMEWEDFLAAIGWEEGFIWHAGDSITIDPNTGQQILDNMTIELDELDPGIRNWMRQNQIEVEMDDFMRMRHEEGTAETFEAPLIGRLKVAAMSLSARLPEIVGGAVEAAIPELDEALSGVIDSIAGVFTGAGTDGGFSPIYRALKQLLHGDILAAIETLIPGMGMRLQLAFGDIGTYIEGAFPNIKASLANLGTQMGDWLLTEAIPSIARAGGLLASTLATSLYGAIKTGVEFFTGGGAAQAVDGIGDYLADTIRPEFESGWQEGLAGSDLEADWPGIETSVQGFVDSIITPLQSGLDTLDFDTLATGFTDLAAGVSDFIDAFSDVEATGLAQTLAVLFAVIINFTNNVLSGTLSGIGLGLGSFGDGLSNIIGALERATTGDVGGALAQIGGGILQLALGLLQIPAGLLDGIVQFFEDLTGTSLPDVSQWIDDIVAKIDDMVNGLDEEFVTVGVQVNWEAENPTWTIPADAMTADSIVFEGTEDGINTAIETALKAMNFDPTLPVENYTVQLAPMGEANYSGDINQQVALWLNEATGETFEIVVVPEFSLAESATTPTVDVPEVEVTPTTTTFDVDALRAGFGAGSMAQDVADTVIPEVELGEELAANIQNAADLSAQNLSAAVIASGMFDSTTFVDQFLIPLDDAWTQYLGPEGSVSVTTATWAVSTAEKTGEVVAALSLVETTAATVFPNLVATLNTNKPIIIGILSEIKSAVDSVTSAFESLGVAAGSLLGIAGSIFSIDGARAEGGPVNAGETYLVGERGPELVTPRSSGTVIPTDALVGGSRDGGSTTIYNENHFHEVSNLDDILYEAERRGINLGH